MAGKYKEMSKIKQVILVAAVPIQRPVGLQEKEREPLSMLFDLVTDNLEEVVSFLK